MIRKFSLALVVALLFAFTARPQAIIQTGTVEAVNIAAGTITATQIAAGTITATEIAANTILGTNIAGATITGSNITAGSIVGSNIAANTITASNLSVSTLSAITANLGAITAGTINLGGGNFTTGPTGVTTINDLSITTSFAASTGSSGIFQVSGQAGTAGYACFDVTGTLYVKVGSCP